VLMKWSIYIFFFEWENTIQRYEFDKTKD
jgi:hypothetical protein